MSHAQSPIELPASEVTIPAGHRWHRWPTIALGVGVVGLGASVALGIGDARQFFHSYLVAYTFFLALALGSLFFVVVQFATRAGWSVTVRRIAETYAATLPLFALLFVPVALGLHDLYHWSHTEAVESDALLQHKAPYLNAGFFYARAVVYFVCWGLLGVFFRRLSVRQDDTGDHGITRRLQALSYPAIVVFALTLTFAAIDWLMSLDPHWYSTMFGVYYFAGAAVTAFALLGATVVLMQRAGLLPHVVTTEHLHDIGKLVFAFTVFWAYIAFSQYLLIWYANMPEETIYYAHRWVGSWRAWSFLLGAGHFGVPFLFLMSRHPKRRPLSLLLGCVWVLAMGYVDMYWLVMPALHHEGIHWTLLDLTTLVGIGGAFLGLFGWLLRRAALVPVRDPRLPESVAFENV